MTLQLIGETSGAMRVSPQYERCPTKLADDVNVSVFCVVSEPLDILSTESDLITETLATPSLMKAHPFCWENPAHGGFLSCCSHIRQLFMVHGSQRTDQQIYHLLCGEETQQQISASVLLPVIETDINSLGHTDWLY